MRRVEPYAGWQRSADSGLTREQKESRAYVLIEEARLRCERLEGAGLQRRFREVHREVGLAGLLVSSELPSWSRKVLLEAARVRSESPMRGVFDADSVLEITIGRACAAVAHCLSAAESAEHVRLAHVHMLTGLGLVQGREPGDPADALNA